MDKNDILEKYNAISKNTLMDTLNIKIEFQKEIG